MPVLPTATPLTFNHVLVPVDGSPLTQIAVTAIFAVTPQPETITLLHVVPPHGMAGDAALEATEQLAAVLRDRLPSCRVTTRFTQGDPATEIVAVAADLQPDMVVMATREFLAPSMPATNTVSVQVARSTSRPVLVAHANPDGWHPRRVLAPLDGSLRSLQALPIAAGLAAQMGASVHLVAVIDPTVSLPAAYAWSCPECDPDLQDALSYLQCQANDLLNQAERSLRAAGIETTSDLMLGKTTPVLLGAIEPDDVVVMTTRGAGPREGTHVGSVATRLLRESPVPVMVFHPGVTSTVIQNVFAADWEPIVAPSQAM